MNIGNITGNKPEPQNLTEIADVTFESNRLVLRVSDPIAARKFGLSDNTWRYEFDGGSMYWYGSKDETIPASWHCSCGKGSYTLADNDTKKQIRSVKNEMANQIVLKGMLEIFGNDARFTGVAIELNKFVFNKDRSLRLREES